MPPIPVALQLWSLRDAQRADFAATARAVAALGFTGVETAGWGNLASASEAAQVLRDANLRVAGMHVGIGNLRDRFDQVVADAATLATRNVVVPHYPQNLLADPDGCARFGEELNTLGARLRTAGLQLAYHNHAHELALVEGRTAFERILDAAEPRNLRAQIDLYWAYVGMRDAALFARRLGNRTVTLHVKDGDGSVQHELGAGKVDFAAIFAAVEPLDCVEWYIIEQEQYNHEPLESIRLCIERMRAWGRA